MTSSDIQRHPEISNDTLRYPTTPSDIQRHPAISNDTSDIQLHPYSAGNMGGSSSASGRSSSCWTGRSGLDSQRCTGPTMGCMSPPAQHCDVCPTSLASSSGGVPQPRHRRICGFCVTLREEFTTFSPVSELKQNIRLLREMLVMPQVEHQNFSLTGRLPAMAILNPRKLRMDYSNAAPDRWHGLVDFQHDQLDAIRDELSSRNLLGVCSTPAHGHT